MDQSLIRKTGAVTIVAALAMLLSACLLTPGKFTSTLDLRRDGRFSYSYKGEIFMLGLSKLAEMGSAEAKKPFTPQPCEDDSANTRKCTAAELADQKQTWATEQRAAADKAKKDAESMKAMMGCSGT